ncbi:MAG: hypothetical protein HZB55_05915 [Deltaproteobacteria bacterium]|nr:hypothetical protein [Deltaproteobacteria bacterium]
MASFQIAEVGIRVQADGGARPAGPEYRPFRDDAADVHVHVSATPETWSPRGPGGLGHPLFDAESTWSLHDRGDALVFLPYSPGQPDGDGGEAEISRDFSYVTVFGLPRGAPVLSYPLDELLFLHLLPDRGGVLLHASAVLWRGRALLFLGPSGSGKTTLSLLWKKARGVTVLSDDRVALRVKGDEIWASGTPWHGTGRQASGQSAPVGGLYLLIKAGANRLRAPHPGEALRGMFRAAFLPHWDEARVHKGLFALDAAIAAFPPQVAEFRPELSAVEELWP